MLHFLYLPPLAVDSSKTVREYTLDKCKKMTIASCSGTNATLVYFNDDACTQFNSSQTFVVDECTATGPKSSRKGKKATCN